MRIGVCAYPLSRGKETGRGLERLVDEFCSFLDHGNISYGFYDNGIIRSEFKAVLQSSSYYKRLKATRDDCYLATYPVAGIFPAFLKKKPLITAVHDLIPFFVDGYDNRIKYYIKRKCIKYACKRSNALIVPFTGTKNLISKMFSIDSSRIFVVPYGVNHSNYYPDDRIQKRDALISFLGEAKRAKGMDTAIKSFAIVLKEFPHAHLQLASNGNELDQMKTLASELLEPQSYSFPGFIKEDDMRRFYNESSVFVFPSRYGFGLSVLEAMACGTPAISGATLDATDFISDPALLTDIESPVELADKICQLLRDKNLYQLKRQESLALSAKYSWKHTANQYYEICNKMVVEHGQ